jgi:hypothetical protein
MSHHRVRTLDVRELAQRLRHPARLQPGSWSPISPSISARGVSAATESDDDVDEPNAPACRRFQRLLAVSGWTPAVIDIDPELSA